MQCNSIVTSVEKSCRPIRIKSPSYPNLGRFCPVSVQLSVRGWHLMCSGSLFFVRHSILYDNTMCRWVRIMLRVRQRRRAEIYLFGAPVERVKCSMNAARPRHGCLAGKISRSIAQSLTYSRSCSLLKVTCGTCVLLLDDPQCVQRGGSRQQPVLPSRQSSFSAQKAASS